MQPVQEAAPAIEGEPAFSSEPPPPPCSSRWQALVQGGIAGILMALLLLFYAPEAREGLLWLMPSPGTPALRVAPDVEAAEKKKLELQIQRLQSQLDAKIPQGSYLIVSTTENRFRLMRKDQITREGLCSTGSYVHLKGADDRAWLFHTPRGAFRIQKKTEKPVWTKPDWAFIEEGRPVPPPGSPERLERGVLGDYSLALGDGYLLHGTLYQRLLGMPVTHGCVRLGDEDLAAIYRALGLGSPVFIY